MTDQEKPKEEEKKPEQEKPKEEEKKTEQEKPKEKGKKAEQPKPKEEGKSKYYFKIIPKEEFTNFMGRLDAALKKTDNKKGDKKILEFEVRGSKEDLKGLALEIFTFDKERYKEFLDEEQANNKDILYCASLNLNVKDEPGVEKLKLVFEQFKPMLAGIPLLKDKFAFACRSQGKQVSFDCVAKDGKLVKALLDLGIDISEYHKFNFALKSGINLAEILDEKADQTANLVKICSMIFSIKSESENVRYLIGALLEALKDVKLADAEIQKKYDKYLGFLNFINSFIEAKLNVEYDAKVLAGEGAKEAEKMSGGSEGLKNRITGSQQMAMGMVSNFLIPMLRTFGIEEPAKALDLDSISISVGVPRYKNGCALSIKVPGLTEVFEKMLNSPPAQMPGK